MHHRIPSSNVGGRESHRPHSLSNTAWGYTRGRRTGASGASAYGEDPAQGRFFGSGTPDDAAMASGRSAVPASWRMIPGPALFGSRRLRSREARTVAGAKPRRPHRNERPFVLPLRPD